MPDDALAKAAEAVQDWIKTRFCSDCPLADDKAVCSRSWCGIREVWVNRKGLARAVLEAVGHDDPLEILRFAKRELPQICIACFRGDCEDCPLREVVKRAKAALERAGEE